MATKLTSLAPSPIERPAPKKKRSCSLLRVVCAVAIVAVAVLGGAFHVNKQAPEFIPIGRAQIPPFHPPCQPFCAPGPLAPYFGPARVRNTPAKTTSIESLVIHPGIVHLKREPDKGYANKKGDLEDHSHHIEMVRYAYKNIKDLPQIKEAEANAGIEDNKGFTVVTENLGKNTTCLFAMNPRKLKNYEKASEHAQTWIQKLDQLSEKEICDELLQSHRTLMTGVGSRKAGKYRNQIVIIFKDDAEDQDRSPKAVMQLIRKRGGTENQVELFRNQILPKFKAKREDFTPEERAVISFFGYPTPPSKEIPSLMTEFAGNLKAMARQMKSCEDFDPIAFAAYAHQELGRIHPFEDGNGRTARLVMNGILKEAGYQAVVFPSEEEYTNAVVRDGEKPGHFANYLRETVVPWAESQFGPSHPCMPELTC